MQFLAALIPLFGNLLKQLFGKIIVALGITAVVYTGFDLMVDDFKSKIVQHVGKMGADWLGLFYLTGGGSVLNILFGAMTFVVSFKTLTKISHIFGAKK